MDIQDFGRINGLINNAGTNADALLAKYGIRVAAIAPGFSDTQMVAGMKPQMQEKCKQRIPLHRFATPEEIAHSALFILENDYFTGRVLEVDGGLRL